MDLDDLKKRRAELYKNYKSSCLLLARAKKLAASLEARNVLDRKLYEGAERDVARLDGRLKCYEPGPAKKSQPLSIESLSDEQLAAVAKMLGISTEGGEPLT